MAANLQMISVAMNNVNNLKETCCHHKDEKYCCIIPKDLHQHGMTVSHFRETKNLMIRGLLGDNQN